MNDQPQTQQVVQTTGSSDPQVKATLDKVLGQVNTAVDQGAPATFGSSLYSPAGSTTTGAWNSALTAASNPAYSTAINNTINSLGTAASGGDYGTNDPEYAALRAKAGDDALKSVNGVFNNSGRLGGGSNVIAAGQGVANALGAMDQTQLQNDRAFQLSAASALPAAFQSSLLPASIAAGVGSAQDANNQGILQGQADLQQRQAQNQTNWLAKISSILNGSAGAAGTTSTTTSPAPAQTPWWQSALGLGIGALGAFA
jgi:hypothetical protein